MTTITMFVAVPGGSLAGKSVQPILPPGPSKFPRVLDENGALPQSIPCQPAWEMYRFRAQVVLFGDKELDWQTGWQLN
jgi:hypothetical protein